MSDAGATIVGLGLSPQGRRLGFSSRELRRQAIDAALNDAGLRREQIDACICFGAMPEDLRYAGLSPRMSFALSSGGASPALSVVVAAGLLATGQAEYVLSVYGEAFTGDAPKLEPNHGGGGRSDIGGYSYGYPYLYGLVGPGAVYALAARRYLDRFGASSEDLAAVAVVERDHGSVRPGAIGYGQPITVAEHQASRMIVDPLRLLDCSRPTDGGAAIVLTSAARAADCAGSPVEVLGAGCGHNITNWWDGTMVSRFGAAPDAARRAFGEAGVGPEDMSSAQLYAPFTIATLLQLEEYGFCGEGEAPAFVAEGHTAAGGSLPTSTGGGQLSGFYATGFTPLSEGILQVRGQAPTNQVPDAELCLVSGSGGNGGVHGSWAHVSLVLGRPR
ncbi:thiolase family protein [Prauserella sp. PE36]|uniref:thiolase family protein n=1 Tax=Prauserella sp. PE36 TaxID=1504709 RepID=UPI000DE225CE|nr:thiolase family protein [Prauserella sp. PE36]RBM16194.1 thiolase family protein [Prauserella sp. PE36]